MDEEKNIVNGQDVQQQADSAVDGNVQGEQQQADNAVSSNEPDEQQKDDNAVDSNEQDEQQKDDNVVDSNEQGEQQKDKNSVSNKKTGKQESTKKRRTAEEIAADKLAREKKLIQEAEEAQANIIDYEKQIAVLLAQKKEAEKKLKDGRNASRTHAGMKIFGDLVNVLGFKEKEKTCYTTSDYEDLRKMMISKVKALMQLEEKNK